MQVGYADVLVGLQYGDEGKARIVDLIAPEYDVIARFNGGANAGHTIETAQGKIALQQIPSGIFYADKELYIGSGCVINVEKLVIEFEKIKAFNIDLSKRLKISCQASIIQPHHLLIDQQAGATIGTTKNGIGPCYADQAMRMYGDRLLNIRIGDFVDNPEFYFKAIEANLNAASKLYDLPVSNASEKIASMKKALEVVAPYIEFDPLYLQNKVEKGARILFEGAQSVMLDVTTGSVPYVTSSHTISGAAYVGGDLSPQYHRKTIGVAKALMSRVGNGPFASEFGGRDSEKYCQETENGMPKYGSAVEAKLDIKNMLASENELDVGIALRILSGEYGTVTTRPRRIGKLDLIQLEHAVKTNGVTDLYINKCDLLQQFSNTKEAKIPLVESYNLEGKEIKYVPPNETRGYKVQPVIKYYPGFSEELSAITDQAKLPENLKNLLRIVEEKIGCKITGIGVGPKRDQFVRMS